MAMKKIGVIFFTAALMVVGFSSWTMVGHAQDDDELNPNYFLDGTNNESCGEKMICVCPKAPKPKKIFKKMKKAISACCAKADDEAVCPREIRNVLKKALSAGPFIGKLGCDLAMIILLVEHMHKISDFKESLATEDLNRTVNYLNNVAQLQTKANGAFLTDVLIGIPTCLGASILDLFVVASFLCGYTDAGLMTLFVSSGFNLITFISSISSYAVLADGLQNNLGGLPEEVREKLTNVLAKATAIVVPTGIEGFLIPIASCCAFWRRD